MRRMTILFLVIALVAIMSMSVVTVSQAWPGKKQEYVSYDLKVIYDAPIETTVDPSGAPSLIIIEHLIENAIDCKIMIGDQEYSYPEDFEISVAHHIELNALTGTGLVRTIGTFTFNQNSHPSLTFWGVARITDFWMSPDGQVINPENFKGQGQFELTGTKKLRKVEGFGLGDTIFNPPEYTNQYVHQTGFIKGWKL